MAVKPATLKVTLAWVVLLIVVAAASLLVAQTNNADKRIVSGPDLGFRVDGERNGVPTGHFVIRVNGSWVEVKESVGVSRVTQ
jgi:hypothetical protein